MSEPVSNEPNTPPTTMPGTDDATDPNRFNEMMLEVLSTAVIGDLVLEFIREE